jgi:hypothetical protein
MTIFQVIPIAVKNGKSETVCYAVADYFMSKADAEAQKDIYIKWGMKAVIKSIEVR